LFGIFIKILEREPDTTSLEISEQKERMKEVSAFHHKEKIVSKNFSIIDAFWNWHCFGISIFYQTRQRSMPCSISLLVLWSAISFDRRNSWIIQEYGQNDSKGS
jgi:hypothetical protein